MIPDPAISELVSQPKDRILDVYGSFGREVGGWIAIASLIELLEPLGVAEQAVRSAASRMKRTGLLESRRQGVAGYALSGQAEQILEGGDARIFSTPAHGQDGHWVIADFSVPEGKREKRYAVRSSLISMGFGQTRTGAWIAPARILAETRSMLQRSDLAQFVTLWAGAYEGFEELSDVVALAWDLPNIQARYGSYLELLSRETAKEVRSDEEAFTRYMVNVAHWRELPYLDPGLPEAVLPAGWPGQAARNLFAELNGQLSPAASRHFRAVVD